MRSHELARKLLEQPDCEVFMNAYETRCKKVETVTFGSFREMKEKQPYSGKFTNEDYDLDPEFEDCLLPGDIPGVHLD